MTARDLTGHVVRTVHVDDAGRHLSEPMLVVNHSLVWRFRGRRIITLKRTTGQYLMAYENEVEVMGDYATEALDHSEAAH